MDAIAWKLLAYADFDAIKAARHQLHLAIQQVSAVGRRYLPESNDDRQANLVWAPRFQQLAGNWIEGNVRFRVSLDVVRLVISLVDDEAREIEQFELVGKSQGQSMVWLEEQLSKLGMETSQFVLNLPYSMPKLPKKQGRQFELKEPKAFEELSCYFHNADHLLRPLKREFPETTEVRCWPQRFDLCTKIILNNTSDPDTTTSINIGLSPGNKYYEMPYFYIIPWPYPSTNTLLPLARGAWHAKNWLGAVLTANRLMECTHPGEQQTMAYDFFKEGLSQMVKLLKPNL